MASRLGIRSYQCANVVPADDGTRLMEPTRHEVVQRLLCRKCYVVPLHNMCITYCFSNTSVIDFAEVSSFRSSLLCMFSSAVAPHDIYPRFRPNRDKLSRPAKGLHFAINAVKRMSCAVPRVRHRCCVVPRSPRPDATMDIMSVYRKW